jgi:type II secretory pathway component PulK
MFRSIFKWNKSPQPPFSKGGKRIVSPFSKKVEGIVPPFGKGGAGGIYDKWRGQRGIALLLVLSSILLLTSMVVEFAYDTGVSYDVAMNERDRLQAFYLAQSAINFSRVVIKFDKESKQLVAKAAKQLGSNLQVQPLYKMIPINSTLLRGLIQAGGGEGAESAESPPEGGGGEADKSKAAAQQAFSTVNVKQAETFLDFEGDFRADIDPEDGKLPLNAFFTIDPGQAGYDRLKNVLIFLLIQKPFEGMFKDKLKEPQELATKIADYVDQNDVINDFGGGERGSEISAYVGLKQKPKNAKLLTVEELMFIPGMTDDILSELKKHVTVYKSTDKINACIASDELLRAMIIAFTQNRTDIEPLRPDNEDRLKNALDKVREKCPDTSAMSQALNEVLGIGAAGSPGATTQPASGSPTTQPAAGTATGAASDFASMISSDETIFKIEATGTVGNAEVKVVDVLNASSTNPDQWSDLYWRIE